MLPIRSLALVAWVAAVLATQSGRAAEEPRRVVLLVWDGMRPDFVSEERTPNLWKFAQQGVTFARHHSVYPTATQVNGTALATGMYPARSGLIANREYRPNINLERPIDTAVEEVIRKGDEVSGGKYLAAPTVAEIVRAAGRKAVVAGSKSVAMLHDRKSEWTTARRSELATVFAGAPMPQSLREAAEKLLGPFLVRSSDTNARRNVFTTRALTEILWRDGVPDYSALWLSEPDLTQHETAPGSPEALAAIRTSDANLATVLGVLEEKKIRASTHVLVVSDHGFSTINRAVDVPEFLRKAGFDAPDRFTEAPRKGQVMVVGNGGSTLFYVVEREPQTIARLVETLQQSDFAGVIFTREKMEGTFDLKLARIDTAAPPDVVMAMRWTDEKNRYGVPGSLVADATRAVGKGTHASLSRHDVHNFMIASGPRFLRGLRSETPSGNLDIAPTVLHLLGIKSDHSFDGRVLREAFAPLLLEDERETVVGRREFSDGSWEQTLQFTRVDTATYFDEGNGAFTLAKPKP